MYSAPPRVVITGVGVLACNGIGRQAFWDAISAGKSGIRTLTRFDPEPFPCKIAGQLWDFHREDFLKKADIKRWHSHVHQSVASAKLAIEDSEFEGAGYDEERIAVAFGTSVGTPDEYYLKHRESFETNGWASMDKFASSATSGHAATANVSARFKLRGPAATLASGCSTGLDIMQWGREQIRTGRADAAVVGATESPITAMTFASASALGILSEYKGEPGKAMRPFDKNGDGIVLSEGAVSIVLEREDYASARGARIFGDFVGYGGTSEGHNPLLIQKEGTALSRAIGLALKDAGMSPQDLDCAQCHGVSLPMYDRCEATAYKKALGTHAYRMPISATKSMIGQAYAAGGLLSVAGALMSLDTGITPPTINLEDPYPECDLDFVRTGSRVNDISSALVTTLSFGGTHAAAILRSTN